MVVLIQFSGTLRETVKTDSLTMPVTEGTRVHDALEYVRKQYPSLHLDNTTTIVTVNHEIASHDRVLAANDIVGFLPFIGGG